MKTLPLLLATALLLLPASSALAVCPDSHFNDHGTQIYVSTPTGGTSGSGCNGFGCYSYAVHFDIPAASLSASSSASGDAGSGGDLYMVDDFNLVGVPDGTPAHLLVNLVLDGEGSPFGGAVSGSILDALGGHADAGNSQSLHTALVLAEDVIAGQPFRLTFYVGDYTQGTPSQATAQLTGRFSFSNVPAGAAIVSCNGYVSDPAVPARATSWGRLKTLYR